MPTASLQRPGGHCRHQRGCHQAVAENFPEGLAGGRGAGAHSCGRAAALIPRPPAIRERSSSLEVLPSQLQLPPDNDGLGPAADPQSHAALPSPMISSAHPQSSAPDPGLLLTSWERGPRALDLIQHLQGECGARRGV